MNSRQLKSNNELGVFLVELSDDLRKKGRGEAAGALIFASRMSMGSPSEFLHEAQQTLKKILKDDFPLTEDQRTDIKSVIDQIEVAFKNIGGA